MALDAMEYGSSYPYYYHKSQHKAQYTIRREHGKVQSNMAAQGTMQGNIPPPGALVLLSQLNHDRCECRVGRVVVV